MIVDGKVVFPHQSPVCKKHEFTEPYEDCVVCGWCNDTIQEAEPNWRKCGNFMSLNEAKEAYKNGKDIF